MRLVLIFFFLSTSFSSFCQEDLDKRYLLATIYIKSDSQINRRILETYKYAFDSTKKIADFKVEEEIWYLPLQYFDEELESDNRGVNPEWISNRNLFKSKFYFNPFRIPFLSKIVPPSKSPLQLTFSKPFDNFLIAEILDSDHANNKNKSGKGIEFLFIFGNDGFIKEVIYTIITYR